MINGDLCHEILLKKIQPQLSYKKSENFSAWRQELKEKFISLTGIDKIALNACDPEFEVVFKQDKGNYTLYRFEFFSEIAERVPCYLLIPKTGKKKYPVAITMQGHVTGFHNSIGVALYPGDENGLDRKSIALQAVDKAARNGRTSSYFTGTREVDKLPLCVLCSYFYGQNAYRRKSLGRVAGNRYAFAFSGMRYG